MGKGSNRRPQEIPADKFDRNWDQIFAKKNKDQAPVKQDEKNKNK